MHAARTAGASAAFFLPYLKPGIDLLDCGCGFGNITVGLAEAIAPGRVTGIDLDEERIAQATAAATKHDVANVTFQTASIYELPFPDESFDAAFENAVFIHLDDPLKAAKEILRVLRPGGFFGARDGDHDGRIWGNMNPVMNDVRDFIRKRNARSGSNYYLGKELRALLRHAGFENVVASASVECHGTPEAMAGASEIIAQVIEEAETLQIALEHQLADEATLKRWAAAIRKWGTDPDSVHILMNCEAVGWKEWAPGIR